MCVGGPSRGENEFMVLGFYYEIQSVSHLAGCLPFARTHYSLTPALLGEVI